MKSWLSLLGLLVAVHTAHGDQYWIAYEGDELPENEGWVRNFSAGGANRYIEDGALVIDSLASTDIYDSYEWPGITNPEVGERFVAEWSVLVEETDVWFDNGVGVARDGVSGDLRVLLGTDQLLISDEWTQYPFAPGMFHQYRLESSDMQSFQLFVDGEHAASGVFQTPSILNSFVDFGDIHIGAASRSRWDYFRFGVAPEPEACVGCVLGIVLIARKFCRVGSAHQTQRGVRRSICEKAVNTVLSFVGWAQPTNHNPG